MRIIVAGGTGFVGTHLVRGLAEDGHKVVLFLRPGSTAELQPASKLEKATVDILSPIDNLNLSGDAIINLVGIIREFPLKGVTFENAHVRVTKNLLNFAHQRGIKRFLQMSALGIRPGSETEYFSTKLEAEECVRDSGLSWTIFRPSVIFGEGDHLVAMLAGMIRKLPLVPVVGDGRYRLQPVHVEDVCAGFRQSLADRRSYGKTFAFSGPDVFTYDEVLDAIGQAIGKKRVRKIHQPIWLMRALAALLGQFSWFPITNEQISMLLRENITEEESLFKMLGIEPKRFIEGLKEYLK